MRKILITVATIVSLQSLAQVNIPVEFNVNQTAEVWIGRKFGYKSKDLANPLRIKFDGTQLTVKYDNKATLYQTDVLDYKRIEQNSRGVTTKETLSLKVENNGMIQYVLIEIDYSFGEMAITLKIPEMNTAGQVIKYSLYSSL